MLNSPTNSQVLCADGETPIRLVTINGIPFWQASGRTFPVVAGAEDPPADPDTETPPPGDGDDFDKDRALATIKKLRDQERAAKAEQKALKERLDALESADKKRQDADRSETEKAAARAEEALAKLAELEKKAQDAEGRLRQIQVDQAIERAATKHGARNPAVVAKLLDRDRLEIEDDGTVGNAEELVKKLLHDEPYLVGESNGDARHTGVPASPRSSGAPRREDKVKEAEEKLIATRQYNPIG